MSEPARKAFTELNDHFKKFDDHAVMRIMNGKNALDEGRCAYFYLERVA